MTGILSARSKRNKIKKKQAEYLVKEIDELNLESLKSG